MGSGFLFHESQVILDSIFYVELVSYRWNRLTVEHLPAKMGSS